MLLGKLLIDTAFYAGLKIMINILEWLARAGP